MWQNVRVKLADFMAGISIQWLYIPSAVQAQQVSERNGHAFPEEALPATLHSAVTQ